MTESFRRSGEYENPFQGEQQHSGYAQGETQQQPTYLQQQHASAPVNPEWPPPPAYDPAQAAPAGPAAPEAGAATAATSASGAPTALLTEPVSSGAAPAPAAKKRARGPLALLAAVAIVAAAIGGGTAYGIQELTGSNTTASSSTSTSVVPTSQKGTVSGVATAVSPSIVEISATSNQGESTGSGVIITSDGEIITNNHVISGASQIKVTTSDGKSYTAEVVGTDSKKDLALIKLQDASGLKAATLGDSDAVKVGDEVVAIGSPEGLTGTVTSGIVSALDRDVTVSTDESQSQDQGGGGGQWPFEFGGQQFNGDTGSSTTTYKAIQTDASLNPGNSGGALIDMNGNIIGINSAMYSASDATSASAGSVGLGFAIPINTVKSDLSTLRAGGSD
ncbi:trypsin-like serine protease [Streptomyces ipomoeae]|uniref:Trypsin-like serine protease n=1 Tax=Streptomyces ipomoeae TaxID=103232 RepID=A0AAE8VTX7_9ACTN|nr:trypsin-like peptidase domain-containing protein [Streptomyces ipomoeae]MDX2696393.1 trypsin-like peptidase domain-containing protein [Streptomyces ipomoeae]MDX2826732.1 trypsin-like peptidase domain-containing protein [Streptomyces ipomoeae]MDX2841916.1 trypsin-like peptidase domain-containing protein [Streptomyces ipomoeae]MDX2879640.1 trypsin-like peptidase domain-containing protein [Streptomyces ipomoeae]TQE15600.1 trypsin-like serine protease [Streptomyces ipomoeae]